LFGRWFWFYATRFVDDLIRPVKRVEGHVSEASTRMETATISDLTMGAVFAGRYRIERRIAAGGMGAVYEVVHLETNRRRALKVMHAHYVSSDELRARFRQEARVAAEVDSDHIVDVFDAGIDEATGMPFLVMELLRGEEIGKLVKRVGALAKEDVVRYLYETSLALDLTHEARIVHRDLKPDNLFLFERPHGPARIKVLDFGIAKIVKDAQTQANATRSLGTPLYMAPEQFLLQSAVSGATDIFALGMIAFTLLVGKPYWFKESTMTNEVLAFALHASRGPTESAVSRAWELHGVELPKAFDAWFFRATARNPAERFATAGEAVVALAKALGVSSPAEGTELRALQHTTPLPNASERGMGEQGTNSALQPEPATILLPSASSSSPSGPLRTGPTQIALTQSSNVETATRRQRASGARTFALMALSAAFVVVCGAWFVVKGFGSAHPVEIQKPGAQAPSVEARAVSVDVRAPMVASVEALPAVDSIPSALTAPERPPSAQAVASAGPTTAMKDAPPIATTSPATAPTVVRPTVPALPTKKKPTKSKDELPDD
jgi:eukaryotic-like serine/threonine-protein kinase